MENPCPVSQLFPLDCLGVLRRGEEKMSFLKKLKIVLTRNGEDISSESERIFKIAKS